MKSIDERKVKAVCEACYCAIGSEEVRRYEDGQPPLTDLQQAIIYQRYQDMVVLKYPSECWDEVSDMFDAIYAEVVKEHEMDALAYC